jgi:hypothetical protein
LPFAALPPSAKAVNGAAVQAETSKRSIDAAGDMNGLIGWGGSGYD